MILNHIFSERNLAVVPTFKKSVCKVQILTFFRIMVSYAELILNNNC
ncbi:hypothetical protein G436_1046 [Leptospira interrogans serovar Hardjo str. Norma]|uniref:Uncharacterized protein n=2 Tax=Leptospira TaxID=171 RepID=A0A0E2B6X2_9LEPT|nr:hypothetical protein G436_1046 [Leptospira interrogans serovar Hardjo str. Norma]EKO17063.1 hypothetical protein LEP1GSC081_4007 [Leptospira kirschneri str. H1]EKO96779.1 hypothetical protein LEP1GSC057_3732 [Leptospira interrogans str. Brem 329]EMN66458.1 hypothetical protein LEP1GSC098_0798 [Leptospira interrogans serovar Grippotyphosa str. UI 08434]